MRSPVKRLTAAAAAGRGRPSLVDDEFEEHRNVITRLYNVDEKPLREVQQIMKDEYGFLAS